MTDKIKIALAQINPKLGDVAGNVARISKARAEAAAKGADLVLAPELVVSGYPPEDLVLKPAFQEACRRGVEMLAQDTADGGPAIIVGSPWVEDGKLHNGTFLLGQGKILAKRFKYDLPNYGVFDEKRVFVPGPLPEPVAFNGIKLGLPICEDLWFSTTAEHLKKQGAELLLVPNGSPYDHAKPEQRLEIAGDRQDETDLPIVYVNQVGGQDELVFDGDSFVLDRGKVLKARLPAFVEKVAITEWQRGNEGWLCLPAEIAPQPAALESIYRAMVLGLKDYVQKNGFPGVLLGLSGGIDSAISAAVAVDALGPDKVRAVMMPSPYTSQESLDDAAACAKLLGIQYDIVSIEPAMKAFEAMLGGIFAGKKADTTEENIQSRSRGLTLMAMSNKMGHMLLTTGNKSEMSVGYATLYGDMCGGYSVLKDVYKMTVFALCRWRNAHFPAGLAGPRGAVMPERVITKPPSAELKPNQTDQDTLPPYDVLDGILTCLVEEEMAVDQIVAKGYDKATVLRVWRMLDLAEYKRRQAPPGVKISRRAFGKDRRYPITNGFRPQ
ncbi:NAD+ synthase [Dongia rigui]|uniref:Glutamine-dependent NAD(+) synthetase n=1 Tax=Dongia rigui TaxID=940149 RepID=A0ABU5E248_9PROT|nr:NAD+ synthase [Dongia rigui]MDY0873289.1 NAD+ synthase [Dongia rigui]